jgi:2'-5' RNA ligase
VRSFVAIELPSPIRQAIAARVDDLRPRLPPARWVAAAELHLTVAFLGEIGEESLPAIGSALGPVFAATPPLRLRLDGAGTFPPSRPARVAWIGVDSDGDLGAVERQARSALDSVLERPLEDRPYHAHVTVARPRRPWKRSAIDGFREGFAGLAGEWPAPRVVLMESRLGGGGGERYRVRQQYPIGEAAA